MLERLHSKRICAVDLDYSFLLPNPEILFLWFEKFPSQELMSFFLGGRCYFLLEKLNFR